jgi:hypothetical protein
VTTGRVPVPCPGSILFIPQNPFWTLTVIALDVLVIWALTAHGDEIADL